MLAFVKPRLNNVFEFAYYETVKRSSGTGLQTRDTISSPDSVYGNQTDKDEQTRP